MPNINELLGKPVADISACPAVGQDDVRTIVGDLESILNKCLYAVRFRLAAQLGIFLSVLAQTTQLQPEHLVRGMSQRAEEGMCLDLFCELTAQMLARVNAALRLDIDIEQLFEVLQVVCADVKMKDQLGGVLGKLLLDYMYDNAQHADDYRVHRGCASALITLLRGSSANKNRVSAECGRIATCLERSADFFFQMQCVEILFRLYTHNRTVLAQASMNDALRNGITSLPNDATLLLSIQAFLDSYNAEFNADRVIPFTIVRMEVAGVEVCSHTTLYFSPLLLVVLLPGGAGDSFTVPFEHIRSVRLSKDHKLGLRLNVVPPKLSLLMGLEEGKDTLQVFLTQSTLARLRGCCVHQWIADRKRNAPRRAVVTAPKSSGPVSGEVPQRSTQSPPSAHRNDQEEVEPYEARSHHGRSLAAGTRSGRASLAGDNPPGSAHTTPRPGKRGSSNSNRLVDSGGVFPITERPLNRPSPHKAEHASGEEGDSRLEEVHHAAAVKAARLRDQQLEYLQQASDRIQDELEETRRFNARDRDSFEASLREDLTAIRRSEASLKNAAAECVQGLNAELADVQSLGALLKAEADKLRERMAKSLGKAEGAEEACLLRIKKLVDTQMQRMEANLSTVLIETNPLTGVSQYLGRRMAELSATDAQPKARRLEYS